MKFQFIIIIAFYCALTYGQPIFQDDFEEYVVGLQLACQDSLNWTTWSISPCNEIEDPIISDSQHYSGTKSVMINSGNDLIKELGNRTTGKWEINFYTFIPEGKQGYFGFFSNFSPDTLEWAFECFLNENGTADLHAGSFLSFDYSQNVWNSFHVVVDLNIDSVEFWFNNDLIKEWRWTLGANGLGCDLKLAATEFYGIIANTSMMFVDNYWFDGNPTSVELDINRNIDFVLQQNFPNPFNPSTKIKYTISSVTLSGVEVSLVILKVFDVLGKEVATLVNEEKPSGTYDVEFNGSNLPSGIYFYQPKAGEYSNTKKMILLK